MPNRVWNDNVFRSYTNIQNFIKGSDAIPEILKAKETLKAKEFSSRVPKNPNIAWHWQVCQVATAPFRLMTTALFLTIGIDLVLLAHFTSIKAIKRLSRINIRIASYAWHGFNRLAEDPTKVTLIKGTRNRPNDEGRIITKTPPIPKDAITDPELFGKPYGSQDGFKFNHTGGICRGITDWFQYLYHNTKDQFSDPRLHMRAIAKQFSKGGGMDPTLLQSFDVNKGKLLGLKIGTQSTHSGWRTDAIPSHEFTLSEWKITESTIAKLQNLKPGSYNIWTTRHAVPYVKINDTLAYLFDSNDGMVEISGEAQGEKLYESVTEQQEMCGSLSRASSNKIEFFPVTKR